MYNTILIEILWFKSWINLTFLPLRQIVVKLNEICFGFVTVSSLSRKLTVHKKRGETDN